MKYLRYYKESLSGDNLINLEEICYEFSDNGLEYEIIKDDYSDLGEFKKLLKADILISINIDKYFKISEWFKENVKRIEHYLNSLGYKVYLQKAFIDYLGVGGSIKLNDLNNYHKKVLDPVSRYNDDYNDKLIIVGKKETKMKHIN